MNEHTSKKFDAELEDIRTRVLQMGGMVELQIVKAMQDIAFGVEDFTVPKYIEWVVANARKFEEVELDVKGETDEELAASLVAEMLRTGLTAKG